MVIDQFFSLAQLAFEVRIAAENKLGALVSKLPEQTEHNDAKVEKEPSIPPFFEKFKAPEADIRSCLENIRAMIEAVEI
jgi:hypothetical protein